MAAYGNGGASSASPDSVTRVLLTLRESGPDGWRDLVPLVYDELRAIAHNRLRLEPTGRRLDTTELVHEAYLKLVDQRRASWSDRAHFFAVASMIMRRILVNEAHRRTADKRGGGREHVPLEEVEVAVIPEATAVELLALEDALQQLERLEERQARVVECRYFGGLSIEETAAALSVSPATVKRDWTAARAWLFRRLSGPTA